MNKFEFTHTNRRSESSIWYHLCLCLQAWSSIVYQLIPNVQQLECNLRNFAQIIEADEVLLFERATFLVCTKLKHCAYTHCTCTQYLHIFKFTLQNLGLTSCCIYIAIFCLSSFTWAKITKNLVWNVFVNSIKLNCRAAKMNL